MPELQEKEISALVASKTAANLEMMSRMRTRRHLINRDHVSIGTNDTGTLLAPPFDKSVIALRTAIGETSKAVQHYATRIGMNKPEISVAQMLMRDEASVRAQKTAGLQERFDNTLWVENGGDEAQDVCAWAATVTGAGYYMTLPRDATFGLPDRMVYDTEDENEIAYLIRENKVSPVQRRMPTGQLVYVEAGDVWAARRKSAMQKMAGKSLFSLRAFPRDMVLREKDADGIKWAAVVEEIPSSAVAAGSELGISAARHAGFPPESWERYGLFKGPSGAIEGGITVGQPVSSSGAASTYNLVRVFTRTEQIIMVSGSGPASGGKIVYRGKHGCTVQGAPAVPIVEVPFIVTDTNNAGQEFSTPMEQIFAYVPLINQLLTMLSNAVAYNLLPRWVIELKDGTTLRGEDGEPQMVAQETVPGLDPSQAAAYPGTVKQLEIKLDGAVNMIQMLVEHLKAVMPAPVMSGVSGTSAPAWQVQQLIQQAQEILEPAVTSHARAVKEIILMWHGWLRQLDVPVCFYSAPGPDKRRYLLEFDPKDLTDSILVIQESTTPEERIVLDQIGMEKFAGGFITDEEYFRDYARKQDVEQAIKDKYEQLAVNAVMPQVIQTVAAGVMGQLNYFLLQTSPNYAIASAEAMAMQATQTMSTAGQPQGEFPSDTGTPNVADTAGVAIPGMGLNNTLGGQLGANKPGVRNPQQAPVA